MNKEEYVSEPEELPEDKSYHQSVDTNLIKRSGK